MSNSQEPAWLARELLTIARKIPVEHEQSEAPGILAEAQVQATLALVDEQRTANLIAFAALETFTTDERIHQVDAQREARERLGLGA